MNMPDLSNYDQLKKYLQKYGLFAQKSFGQNYLIDPQVLDRITAAADLRPEELVVEVGPGPGVLSQRIAPLVHDFVAVELDERMIAPWSELMKPFPHARIVHQDVLKYTPEDRPYKLVANIPYYITSPILKHFLREQTVRRPEIIVLMIQREVAERIVDQEKPTLLSWEIALFGKPELVTVVKASSFFPAPKVDSAVLKISVLPQPLLPGDQLEEFFQLLGCAYKQPRKTLFNNLSSAGKWGKEEVSLRLKAAEVDPVLRPHQLRMEDWNRLLNFF